MCIIKLDETASCGVDAGPVGKGISDTSGEPSKVLNEKIVPSNNKKSSAIFMVFI